MFTPYSSTFSDRNTATTDENSDNRDQQGDSNTNTTTSSPPPSAADLPPEALALASKLFESARRGDLEIFEQVLKRSRRIGGISNEKGDSLIMLSSYHGHLPLTKLLLSYGVDPNRLNERQQSPLAGAIFKGEDDVITALLEGGADPRIGKPSALEAVAIFGQQEKWGARMLKAAEEAERRNGKLGNGNGTSPQAQEVDGDGDEIYAEARVPGE